MLDWEYFLSRGFIVSSAGLIALIALDAIASVPANAQIQLPELTVRAAKKSNAQPRPVARRVAPSSTVPPVSPAEVVAERSNSFDQARSNLFTTIGTTSDTLSRDTIQALPQGANAPVERVLLQAPGVTQDSAASGSLHVRNEHGNLQYRINGVALPDGVTGFGSVLDTNFIGSLSLVTGALPAEFGLRTVGILDLTTRKDIFNNSGSINYYFGSRERIQPSFEYGGTFGANCPTANAPLPTKAPASSTCFGGVQYFFTGSYFQTNEGIENTLPTLNPIHDFSRQEKGFAYLSTFLDPYTRLSLIAGTFTGNFQIPNVTNQPTKLNSAFGVTSFDSATLNERQNEQTQYGVLALQRSVNGFDGQLSYFTRYNNLHFIPDPTGDLLLNGVASDISRQSYTNGFQGDAAYAITPAHTLRAGFTVSAEQIWVDNTSLVEGTPPDAGNGTVFPITDDVHKVGWLAGAYVQDEWKITDELTLNAGLRFDQMWQFVEANQLSPRVSLTYKPFENTTLHAGYARYFTPPVLVEAAPVNFNLFNNTTAAVTNPVGSSVLPERSHYFDAGINQVVPLGCYSALPRDCASAEFGVDAYYKIATDLLDDGNFGQALVLNAFNYAKGINEGVEFSAKFHSSYLEAYFNYAYARQKATNIVSNQFLFDNATPVPALGGQTEFQYIATHWVYTDHAQIQTASAGAAFRFCGRPAETYEAWSSWCGTKLSADMIYGSGLRSGPANIDHQAPYAQFNAGISRQFAMADGKPVTLRFDVVNLLNTIYELRNGTGIGVFAPQFGPRRGYFFGISKKI
jgi:outer membrane receptor protein involved in Fe transport